MKKIVLFLLLFCVNFSFSQTLTFPTFNEISPICYGNTLSELPNISTNGITGSWTPSLNNTQSGIYTFTPDEGQNARNTTLTLIINPLIVPTFDEVGIFENSSINFALPSTSTNGIHGLWSPSNILEGQNTYIFIPNPNQCAIFTTITLYFMKLNVAQPLTDNQVVSRKGKISPKKNTVVYPNPSNDDFNIDLTNSNENYKNIKIYNVSGNLMYQGTLTKSLNRIEFSSIPTGQYFAHLYNGEKKSVIKLVKN
jgi:hypothetical protein